MDAINQFMADRQCEQPLMQRVREYFLASKRLQRVARERVPPSPSTAAPFRLSARRPPHPSSSSPSRRSACSGCSRPPSRARSPCRRSPASSLASPTSRTPRPSSTSSSQSASTPRLRPARGRVGQSPRDPRRDGGGRWRDQAAGASVERGYDRCQRRAPPPLAGVRAHVPRMLRARAARARAHRLALPRPLQGDPQGCRPPRPPPLAPAQPPQSRVFPARGRRHRDSPFTLPGGIGGESSMPPMEAPVGSRSSLNRLGSAHASRPGSHAPHAIQRLPSWRVKTAKGVSARRPTSATSWRRPARARRLNGR